MKKLFLLIFLGFIMVFPTHSSGSNFTKKDILKEWHKAKLIMKNMVKYLDSRMSKNIETKINQENACYQQALIGAPAAIVAEDNSETIYTPESLAVKQLRDAAIFRILISNISLRSINKIIYQTKLKLFRPWQNMQKKIMDVTASKKIFSSCPALERWQRERYMGITDIADDVYGDSFIYSYVNQVSGLHFMAPFYVLSLPSPWKRGEVIPARFAYLLKAAYDQVLTKRFPGWWKWTL